MTCINLEVIEREGQSMSRCPLHPEYKIFQTWANCQTRKCGCKDFSED